LIDSVFALAQEGYDVKNLGIEGLNLNTDFSKLDDATVKKMTEEMLIYRGRAGELAQLKNENMRSANVAAYTANEATFNALQGTEDDEWADEHQDAL
jgi:hypothetical protein